MHRYLDVDSIRLVTDLPITGDMNTGSHMNIGNANKKSLGDSDWCNDQGSNVTYPGVPTCQGSDSGVPAYRGSQLIDLRNAFPGSPGY